MSGPEFFQTGMGRKFYDHDIPEIARQLKRLADALEKPMTKEYILKTASEDELFCLFHTFKEYFNENIAGKPSWEEAPEFRPLDKQIGEVVALLKKTYR